MALSWNRLGAQWPNGHCSRFLNVRGVNWHVQVPGSGPAILLLHGTGASTHSWRDLIAPLAARFTVMAPDLPGHDFSSAPESKQGYALPDMACSLAARRLAATSLVPGLVARRASDSDAVRRLIGNTGSRIDPEGMAYYQTLMADPQHVRAVLAMMGQWDLRLMERDLPRLSVPLLLAVAGNDRSMPSTEAERIRAVTPHASSRLFAGLGHLAHEERPGLFIELLEDLQAT